MTQAIKVSAKSVIYDTLVINSVQIKEDRASVHASLHSDEVGCPFPYFLDITPEEYAQWGTDDNYIVDLVLSKLGLVKA
jgi:hypothetical protein